MALRLILAEDSYLMREGITALLDLDDELDLVDPRVVDILV